MTRIPSLAGATLTLALALVLAAPASAAAPQLPTQPMAPDETGAIDAGIATLLAAHPGIPAIYVGIWDPIRGAYQQAYGVADPATGRAATTDDVFRIGSVSKTFTATVILQLIDEGKLRLADTVAIVLPELAMAHPALASITVEQLLGMTSGIPDYLNVPDAAIAAIAHDPSTVWTLDQLIAYGADGAVSPPGTPGYSSTNYVVLQAIAEHLTGTPLRDLIAERATGPLGMTRTALPPDDDTTLPDPVAHGVLSPACVQELQTDGAANVTVGTDTTDWNASYGQGAGGMHSTIADLGVWAASLSGTSLLSPASAQARQTYRQIGLGPLTYGLGLIQFGDQVGHEGEAIGWEGWVGQHPATGRSAVVFTTSCADSEVVFRALAILDPAFAPTARDTFGP
ncbi:MAG: serine hydrolase domain-containing protein [Chloroflexota bacterium]